jgi:hypothetical protein
MESVEDIDKLHMSTSFSNKFCQSAVIAEREYDFAREIQDRKNQEKKRMIDEI